MRFALEGLRVLDFGQGAAGPYCGQLLADHGADVIKVEPPRGDWSREMGIRDAAGLSGTFVSVNRNKHALCLDLKRSDAVAIARALALRADVIVESFRPGVMDRLGLGYEELKSEQSGLVYCSITGFGDSGPNVELPAGDSTMQAYGGLMSIVGEANGDPLRVGNVVADMVAGTNAFSGVVLALYERGRTGKGSRIGVSLLDSIVAFQAPPLTEYLLTGTVPQRLGNQHPLIAPSGAIRARDAYLSFTVLDHQWEKFCDGLGLGELMNGSRFKTSAARQANRDALRQLLEPVFREKTVQEWLVKLRAIDVLCAPINEYPELVRDPQVVHNRLLETVSTAEGRDFPMVRNPVRIEGEPTRYQAPPKIGEHTRQILASELGWSESAINDVLVSGAAVAANGR